MSNKNQSHPLIAHASSFGSLAFSTGELLETHKTFTQGMSPLYKLMSSTYKYSDALSQAILSQNTNLLSKTISGLKHQVLPSSHFKSIDDSIEMKLFNASSQIKILTSQVAMHLDSKYREKLYFQIDSLHDINDWDPDDKPIQTSSFKTFLKIIVHIRPQQYPSLGLAYSGHLLAAWVNGKDRLTLEFLPNDIAKWVLSTSIDGTVERSTGQASLNRLLECLAPFHPENWFFRNE